MRFVPLRADAGTRPLFPVEFFCENTETVLTKLRNCVIIVVNNGNMPKKKGGLWVKGF